MTMKRTRSLLFFASITVVLCLLGGGLAVQVGAGERSYHQVVLFSEVLSLVMENYVDPVEADALLSGAYEGMLGGLDANGAWLSAAEVADWKQPREGALAHPGLAVLKSGAALQVVAVSPGSPADEAGIEVGDQIRTLGGMPARELSLRQAWRLLEGPAGSSVSLDLLHFDDEVALDEIRLERRVSDEPAYTLDVVRGVAVLRVARLERIDAKALAGELDDVGSRGVETLLVDLRNTVEGEPRHAAALAGLFLDGPLLRLRDRSGRVMEEVDTSDTPGRWGGEVAVLVNGATAGAGEALAVLLRDAREALVLGESTYGLGAAPTLYELEDGSALLLSSATWETAGGSRWNGEGVDPDEEIRPASGDDWQAAVSEQLERALDRLTGERAAEPAERPAA